MVDDNQQGDAICLKFLGHVNLFEEIQYLLIHIYRNLFF